MSMQQLQSQQQGRLLLNRSQTIVEIFIALMIFSIAFISLIVLVNNYIKILKTAKDRIIANFLAQEGIDLVIAKRNINKAQKLNWLDGFYNNFCIDINLNIIQSNDISNCPLYINNNQFTHTPSSTSTTFSRLISLTTSTHIATVTSMVQFEDQTVELQTIITDWIP